MTGLELDDLSVDGSITKSPCGGELSGRSPIDRGKQGTKRSVACDLLEILGYHAEIAVKGTPAPIQASKRWPVERTHSWMNGYGKLRRFTEKRKIIVEFYLYLAAALTVIRRLINRARTHYRWPTRETHYPTPPLTIICRSLLANYLGAMRPIITRSTRRLPPRSWTCGTLSSSRGRPTACDHDCTSTSPPSATPESERCKPRIFIENGASIRTHTTPLSAALKLPRSNRLCHSCTPWRRLQLQGSSYGGGSSGTSCVEVLMSYSHTRVGV